MKTRIAIAASLSIFVAGCSCSGRIIQPMSPDSEKMEQVRREAMRQAEDPAIEGDFARAEVFEKQESSGSQVVGVVVPVGNTGNVVTVSFEREFLRNNSVPDLAIRSIDGFNRVKTPQ